jgi:hypothetical protein
MPDFLPFGLGRTLMIVAGFALCTGRVCGPHVVGLVLSSQFQRPDVLNDPAVADTIDAPLTQDADSSRPFPDGKPQPW